MSVPPGRAHGGLSAVLLGFAALWLVSRLIGGLEFPLYGDETEKILAARMIAGGQRLYGDVFAHHGPLNYLLAHIAASAAPAAEVGDNVAPYRAMQVLVACLGMATLWGSVAPRTVLEKRYFIALTMLLYGAYFLNIRAYLLLYHAIGGLLFANILFLFCVPAALGRRPPRGATLLSGAFAALALLCSYSYALPLAFLFLSAVVFNAATGLGARDQLGFIGVTFLGVACGAVPVVLWLVCFGDLPGYLVFHFYFNQMIYAGFIEFSLLDAWGQFALGPGDDPRIIWPALVMLALPVFLAASIHRQRGLRGLDVAGIALLFLGVLYMNARNETGYGTFKAAPLQISCLAIVAFMLARLTAGAGQRRAGTVAALGLCGGAAGVVGWLETTDSLARNLSRAAMARYEAAAGQQRAEAAAMTSWLDARLGPDVGMVSTPWNVEAYLLLGRAPAIATFYYLPWQAAYERRPALGLTRDYCAELDAAQPAILLVPPGAEVWGHAFDAYAPCVRALVETSYAPTPFPGLFLRAAQP